MVHTYYLYLGKSLMRPIYFYLLNNLFVFLQHVDIALSLKKIEHLLISILHKNQGTLLLYCIVLQLALIILLLINGTLLKNKSMANITN